MSEEKKQQKPEWVKIGIKEFESLVLEIAKKESNPAKIGIILRDQHGIPKAKLVGKKITHILDEHKSNYTKESDLVKSKVKNLERHLAQNKTDYSAKKSLIKKLWIVNKA